MTQTPRHIPPMALVNEQLSNALGNLKAFSDTIQGKASPEQLLEATRIQAEIAKVAAFTAIAESLAKGLADVASVLHALKGDDNPARDI